MPARSAVRLALLRVATPCQASWEAMVGDARVRRCDACACDVHNLSAWSAQETERLLAHSSGRLCVRFQQRRDGSPRVRRSALLPAARRLLLVVCTLGALSCSEGATSSPQAHPLREPPRLPVVIVDAAQAEQAPAALGDAGVRLAPRETAVGLPCGMPASPAESGDAGTQRTATRVKLKRARTTTGISAGPGTEEDPLRGL